MSMRGQALSGLAIIIGIYLIISLSRDLQQLISTRERIEREQNEVLKLEQEQQELASDLGYVLSDEFVETEARDKLLMGKPGEVVVLLPTDEESSVKSEQPDQDADEEDLANWEKWLRLFL